MMARQREREGFLAMLKMLLLQLLLQLSAYE